MRSFELLNKYTQGERNFHKAKLSWTNLSEANLSEANLCGANLYGANLYGANLSEANLSEANLCGANLRGANLRGANPSWTNLSEANLYGANLCGANLCGANLYGANLYETNLYGADLSNTCLDPKNIINKISKNELITAGFEMEGDFVIGYRTKKSQNIENNIYSPGEVHVAQYFSVDKNTECHPGLYFASLKWLTERYSNIDFVRVAAINGEIIHAGNKWRAKRLMVLPYTD